MLKEEEKLYFLLIDIMRSPHIFKEISGSSIKDDEKPPEEPPKPVDRSKSLRKTVINQTGSRKLYESEDESGNKRRLTGAKYK